MPITTISSRELNQDLSRAKRATKDGPVFITDRGRPAHVLLSIDEYRAVTRTGPTLLEMLAPAKDADAPNDFEFDFPKLHVQLKDADFD